MGVVLFWVPSLSSVGINTYLKVKVDKEGKVSELSEMMLFDKEFHRLSHEKDSPLSLSLRRVCGGLLLYLSQPGS